MTTLGGDGLSEEQLEKNPENDVFLIIGIVGIDRMAV